MSEPNPSGPQAVPVPTADRPARPRWRKWLLYALAAVGVLALVLTGLVVRHALRDEPASVSADAQIDEGMTRNYGKYSPEQQGWLYVNPDDHQTYVMRVVHRAKMEEQAGPDATRFTGLYFLASGARLDAAGTYSLVGLFAITPEPGAKDGTLREVARANLTLYGTPAALQPEDVRFEALSNTTWGWVLKVALAVEGSPASRFVTNLVYAPVGDEMAHLASFTALAQHTPKEGCEAAEAAQLRRENASLERELAAADAAASAASDATTDTRPDAGSEDDASGYDEEGPGTTLCSDASWTYKTGPVPSEGFVTLSVTGGGLYNGQPLPRKTHKLVFDPKAGRYRVPDELHLF